MKDLSWNKQKILLLLLGGIALGFSYTPAKRGRVLKTISREWKKIDRKRINVDIRELYRSKLVAEKQNTDGSFTLFLTKKGKMKALTYHFATMKISKGKWDGRWRIVVFDIPEKIRNGRDALRAKLFSLGFHEFQKSVFVFPYECKDEVEFVVEFFGLRSFVRYGVLSEIDNDFYLRNIFHLSSYKEEGGGRHLVL